MTQQTTPNYLTKEELVEVLQEALKPYPTKKDVELIVKTEIKKELKNYPTKDDLRREIQYSEMRTGLKIEEAERRFEDKAHAYRDDVLTRMDEVVGELAQSRDDNTFRDHEIKTLQEQVKDHDTRIMSLEDAADKD